MKPFLALFLLLFTSIHAKDIVDNNTGTTFPSEVSFTQNGKEYHLDCTGVATRKKFFVKVYSVAHYLQTGAKDGDKFALILQDDFAKQLTVKWVHEAPAAKLIAGYRDSFKIVFSESDEAKLKNEIEAYLQFFNHDVAKGEEQIIRWTPGGYLEVLINGKSVGHLTSKEFAKGLWSIWFGPKSVVDRDQLISLINK